MSKLENVSDTELIEELAFRMQLKNIKEQCKHSRYCPIIGTDCKYMQDGKCTSTNCKRR